MHCYQIPIQEDIPLYELDNPLAKQLYLYLITQRQVIHNTTTKYVGILKGMLDRAVAHGWLTGNPFFLYKTTYKKVHHDWLPMEKFEELLHYKFAKKNSTWCATFLSSPALPALVTKSCLPCGRKTG